MLQSAQIFSHSPFCAL